MDLLCWYVPLWWLQRSMQWLGSFSKLSRRLLCFRNFQDLSGSLHSKQTPVLLPSSKQGHPPQLAFGLSPTKKPDPDVRLLLVDLESVFLTLVRAVYIFLGVKLQRIHILFSFCSGNGRTPACFLFFCVQIPYFLLGILKDTMQWDTQIELLHWFEFLFVPTYTCY